MSGLDCQLAALPRRKPNVEYRSREHLTEREVERLIEASPATHPLTRKEVRALRWLQREQRAKSPFVFVSERGVPFSKRGF
jgi:integrase